MAQKLFPFDDPDARRSGNIWGWKFSFISLAVILLMAGLLLFRWLQLGRPSLRQYPAVEQPAADTLKEEEIK